MKQWKEDKKQQKREDKYRRVTKSKKYKKEDYGIYSK